MRKLFQVTAALAVLLFVSSAGFAANAADFYLSLLRRGVADFDAGRYQSALPPLRIAAFGLIEASDRYQVAQVYVALAADRLGQADAAREAAQRVVAAERVQKSFASLAIPAPVRASFETLANKALTASEIAALTAPAQPKAEQPKPKQEVESKPPPQQPAKAPETTPAAPAPKNPPRTETQPPAKPAPATTKPPAPKPVPTAADFAAAEKALAAGELAEAQRIYRRIVALSLTHAEALRVAEGFYRARDFAGVLRAFDKAGTLARGEEPYRYYRAVALYETGQIAAAKKELAAALPFIQLTPDVTANRRKIEGAK